MAKVLGIDLGTTFSVAAYIDRGRPVVIPNAEGGRLTPSVVAFLQDGGRLVGQLARAQAVANPQGTIFSIKRHMGRQRYLDLDGGEHERYIGSDYRVRVDGREYTPEQISAFILQKVKADAESHLGEPVAKAVVSVPAYFSVSQRQATLDAAHIAGLEVLRIVDEPTAAALAYGLDLEEVHTVLVWDLGGGTFDVSILELGDGVFEVKAVSGDTWLGGDDFDQRIADYLAGEVQSKKGVDLRHSKADWRRLGEIAEKAKLELSEAQRVDIKIPLSDVGGLSPESWETRLSRSQFEELAADLWPRMVGPTRQALIDAGLRVEDIDRVILVGGATRMPAVRQLVTRLMGREPYTDVPADEAVALGAAIQAGILTGEIQGKVLLSVVPLSLGIETQGGLFTKIIERNTPIPICRSQVFTNAADHQAAMEIHVLQGEEAAAQHDMTLDRFELSGVPPLPRGEARVEVTFDIDVNGILRVTAYDLYSDSCHKVRISPRFYGLSPQELQHLRAEAESHASPDNRQQAEAPQAHPPLTVNLSCVNMLTQEIDGSFRHEAIARPGPEGGGVLSGAGEEALGVDEGAYREGAGGQGAQPGGGRGCPGLGPPGGR